MQKPAFRILLIEDNQLDTKLFRVQLNNSGVVISWFRSAESLEESIRLIRENQPDLIFLDLSLTDSNGIGSYLDLKQHTSNTPVIILTGNEDETTALEALRQGAQDYILKSELNPGLLSRTIMYSIQRKKIETELIRAKANTDALIENTKDGIWSIDINNNFITINSRFAEAFEMLSGKKPMIGSNMMESLPVRYRDWFQDIVNSALNGEQFRVETKLELSGTPNHIELSVNPIRESDGSIAGVSFFARNINQRKVIEERVRKSEHAYRLLLETINEGVIFIDKENQVQFANRKFTETTGFDEEDLIGFDFNKILAEDEKFPSKNIVNELLNDNNPVEIHIRKKSGEVIWFRMKGTPLLDSNGQIAGTLLTHTEITEQKRAEETIRKQEQEYYDLVEAINEGLVYLDSRGLVKFVNRKFLELSGYTEQELLGNTLPAGILPGTLLQLILEDSIEKTESKEFTYQYELQITNKLHEKRWCMMNCSITRDANNQNLGILATYTDITDRKFAEEKLQVAQRELNTFIYKSSHDLKGPLSSIIGLLNLADKEPGSETHSQFFSMIRNSAEKLDRMLNELLNVVRIKKDKIYPSVIDFNELTNSVMEHLKFTPGFSEVKGEIIIDSKTPLRTDKRLLQMILQHIIDNSIRYRKCGSNSTYRLHIFDFLNGVKIELTDNGKGIDQKIRENIFSMFNRGIDSTDSNGLGLYVVKNAIDRLGGIIEVHSNPGENTHINIFLPDVYNKGIFSGEKETVKA